MPDPEDPRRRWVFVWDSRAEAQEFADELRDQSGVAGWRVEETAAPPSDGPFGPVLIQLARRSDGLVMSLHPLSLAMIRQTFTDASPEASSLFIGAEIWANDSKTQGTMSHLVEEIARPLTGLDLVKLNEVG